MTSLRLPYSPKAVISGVVGREDTNKGRWYVRPSDQLRLRSVTSVIDATSQNYFKNWHIKLAAQAAIDNSAAIFKLNKRAAACLIRGETEKLSLLKADIGSHQHHILEALAIDQSIPEVPAHLQDIEVDGDSVDHDVISDGLLNFFTAFADVEIEMAEATVANPNLGFAGTLDLILHFPSGLKFRNTNGDVITIHRLLVDLKVGKHLKKTMRTQLAAYRFSTEVWIDQLGNTVPMPIVDGAAVLHLRREYENGYKLIVVDAGIDQFTDFVKRLEIVQKEQNDSSRLGDIVYPPLPDGSQPLPLVEDVCVPGFSYAKSALKKAGLRRLEDLAHFTETDIRSVKGISDKTLESCRTALAQFGLAFASKGEN